MTALLAQAFAVLLAAYHALASAALIPTKPAAMAALRAASRSGISPCPIGWRSSGTSSLNLYLLTGRAACASQAGVSKQ
jgi:hypothetical protein